MPKIIFIAYVQDDGVGDLSHLVDICFAVKQKLNFANYEFVLMASYGRKHTAKEIENFHKSLKEVNAQNYFLYPTYKSSPDKPDYPHDEFKTNPLMHKELSAAEQIIFISSHYGIPDRPMLERHTNKKVTFKFIGEHECIQEPPDTKTYSMGLRGKAYGIKLKKLPKINLETALQVFARDDKWFYDALLKAANLSNGIDFSKKNILVPAYFNKLLPPFRLMLLLVTNKKMCQITDLNFFITGKCCEVLVQDFVVNYSSILFKNTNVKQIECMHKNEESPTVFQINEHGSRTIRVFLGYYLNKTSYQALHQQACISGVSGDNSFEMAAGLSLPYYTSTNAIFKQDTILTLAELCGSLDLPELLKADFEFFFRNLEEWNDDKSNCTEAISQKFEQIDLPGMMSHWHLFSDYLFKHYNFYDKLESIILDLPVLSNQEHFESLQEKERAQSEASNFKRPKLLL